VAMENFCEMCGDPDEYLYYVFFQCLVTKRFWGEVKKLSGVMIPNLHPWSWATDVLCGDVCTRSMTATLVCGA